MKDNYGTDGLTYEKMQMLITEGTGVSSGFFGPIIEKSGKYYITTLKENANIMEIYEKQHDKDFDYTKYYGVTSVIDRTTSVSYANKIVHNLQKDFVLSKQDYDVEKINKFIKEVESATGYEIGNIELHEDNKVDIYDLNGKLMSSNVIKERKEENTINQFDVLDIVKDIGIKEKYLASEKLDEKNTKVIKNQLMGLYPNSNFEIKKNSEGKYEIKQDGKTVLTFAKDITLSEAVSMVNEQYNNGKAIQNYNKDTRSTKLIQETNQGYRIHIDVESFNEATESHKNAKTFVEQAINDFHPETYLTEKLKEAYEEISGSRGNVNIKSKLEKTTELLDNVITNVHYSLQAYENIDHNLGVLLESIISEIFSMNNYKNKETTEFYSGTLEEREQQINRMISELEQRIKSLEEEYNKKYPGGRILFSEDMNDLFLGIGCGFGFIDANVETDVTIIKDNGFQGTNLLEIIEFIDDNDALTKMKSYAEGSNWKESGMSELYQKKFGIDSEENFLHCFNSSQDLSRYSTTGYLGPANPYIDINDERKLFSKIYLSKLKSLDEKITAIDQETGNLKLINMFEYANNSANDCVILEETINGAKYIKNNYEQYQKIMPYEGDMEGDTYLEYLTQDWSNVDLSIYEELNGKEKYLSQKEIALFLMYKGFKNNNLKTINNQINNDKALGYIEAMDDMINQRKGLEEAALRINEYNNWIKNGGIGSIWGYIKSGADGFSDGMEGFFNGIGNVLASDGKRSASDYRNIYMINLLKDGNVYNQDLSLTQRTILKNNYNILKSVGTMTIPVLSSFVPYAGGALSPTLVGLMTFGNSTEMAKQNGVSDARAYLYGGFSALSTVALNKLLSGIVGLNGQTTAPNGLKGFLTSSLKQSGRAYVGAYVDAAARASILGETIDISQLQDDAFESAINGFAIASILNGGAKISLKLADKLTITLNGDKYRSYGELLTDCKKQFYESNFGQKMLRLKGIFTSKDLSPQSYGEREISPILRRWIEEYNDDSNEALINVSDKANEWGFDLKSNERMVYDPNTNKYYIANDRGNVLSVPDNWLPNHEPGPITPARPQDYYSGTDKLLHLYSGDEQIKLYGHVLGEDNTLTEIDTFKSNPTKDNADMLKTLNDFAESKKSQNNPELFHIDTVPTSEIPERQIAIKKIQNGEELTLADKMALGGRDHVVREIDGYKLKPDHAYRKTDLKAFEAYLKEGKIIRDIEEYIPGENNGGVDWYLGGSVDPDSRKYSSGGPAIILETPADTRYFVLTQDNGLGMADDYHIRHLKSSSRNNPIPLHKVNVIKGKEEIEMLIKSRITDLKTKLSALAMEKGMTLKSLGEQRGSEVDPVKQQVADKYASHLKTVAETIEPKISEKMVTFENPDLAGIEFDELQYEVKSGNIKEFSVLMGYDSRIKGKSSMSRKILSLAEKEGIKLSTARERIGDSVRYTLLFDDKNYIEKINETVKSLRKDGYDVEVSNNWGVNPQYQGVNASIVDPSGTKFELQFHTLDSFNTKEYLTHLYYEIKRNDFTTSEEKTLAKLIQMYYQYLVHRPEGIVNYDFNGGKNE